MSNRVITHSACNNTLSMYFDARCVSLNTHCVFLHMVIFWVIYIGLQRLVKTEFCICLQTNNWGISGRYKKDKFQVEVSGLLRWFLGHPLSSLHSYSMHHQGRVSIEFWFSFTIFCILFRAFARHVNRRRPGWSGGSWGSGWSGKSRESGWSGKSRDSGESQGSQWSQLF